MTSKQKTVENNELIRRERELRNKMEEIEHQADEEDSADLVNYRTYITGLLKGKVVDVEPVSRNYVELQVRTDEGMFNVTVRDTGEYSDDNEMVRLLEWKGIEDGRIGDLLDKQITLVTSDPIFDRGGDITDDDLSVFIPNSLDMVGRSIFRADSSLRRVGIPELSELSEEVDDMFESVLGTMLICCIIAMIYLISTLIFIPVGTLVGSSAVIPILAAISTVLFGVEVRGYTEIRRRYRNYRNRDAVQN